MGESHQRCFACFIALGRTVQRRSTARAVMDNPVALSPLRRPNLLNLNTTEWPLQRYHTLKSVYTKLSLLSACTYIIHSKMSIQKTTLPFIHYAHLPTIALPPPAPGKMRHIPLAHPRPSRPLSPTLTPHPPIPLKINFPSAPSPNPSAPPQKPPPSSQPPSFCPNGDGFLIHSNTQAAGVSGLGADDEIKGGIKGDWGVGACEGWGAGCEGCAVDGADKGSGAVRRWVASVAIGAAGGVGAARVRWLICTLCSFFHDSSVEAFGIGCKLLAIHVAIWYCSLHLRRTSFSPALFLRAMFLDHVEQ